MTVRQEIKDGTGAVPSSFFRGIEAGGSLAPASIAVAAEDLGVKKAASDPATLFALAMLAGAFIGLGAMFATTVVAGAEGILPYGVIRLLAGLTFSLGLILVLIGGAQLFTGDMLMVMAWASRRLTTAKMVKVWTTVWLGNLVGGVITAALVFASGQFAFGGGAVGAAAVHYAEAKAALPFGQAFALGILCNVLVCLAVWLALAGRTVADRIIAIVFPVTAFVAAGFEHCVANMYYLALGLFISWGAPKSFWSAHGGAAPEIPWSGVINNLVAVTAGNWVGGALLVGGVYWFIYRRPGIVAKELKHD
ncbi:formate/nitrite transporter family protein [Consotaella salsifontis]|uniref:Formate/nitrite transporter n=1 Tax=Consotaella salsifontis TaxID=1365950 RepID=A0A1T4LEJ8_9HYPH|nr:formate/nitrite transporter family protein [Consotaella salsifontis]SJZ52987.1 formate/nitrite transporter [Consotaella salsifontis]